MVPGMDHDSHLRVYRFQAAAALEGQIVGALEHLEAAGEAGVLDALFVARDAATGELQAIDLATGHADGTIVPLLDFRLDPRRRPALTQKTLAPHPGGVPSEDVEEVAAAIEPGGAVLAVLLAEEAPTLDDAVSRGGGHVVADEHVTAGTLAEVAARLRSAL